MLNRNSEQNKVLVGKDGWLFLTNDTNRNIDQITGKFVLSKQTKILWENVFAYRKNRMAELGAKYLFAISPNKESIYHEKLPDNIQLSGNRVVFDVMNAAAGKVDVCYPVSNLCEAASHSEVYIKGDTHWNGRGAYVFYRDMMLALNVQPVPREELVFSDYDYYGDLSSKIGHRTVDVRIGFVNASFSCIYNNNVSNVGSKLVFENRNSCLPKAVVFRDSFSTALIGLYAQTFSRVTCVWQPNIDYGLVAAERPDIVVSQQVERFLTSCPDDVGGKTNAEYAAAKAVS